MRLIDAEELGFRILEETSDTDETANKIYGLVINAPTIEPKRGRWITHGVAKGSEMCDQCGFVQLRHRVNNYCPYCGAKMEDEE